jgi:hypothetical protein
MHVVAFVHKHASVCNAQSSAVGTCSEAVFTAQYLSTVSLLTAAACSSADYTNQLQSCDIS